MQCTTHTESVASGTCTYSGKPFCRDCLVEIESKFYGKPYLDRAISDMRDNEKSNSPHVFMNAGGGGGAAANAVVTPPVAAMPLKTRDTAWLFWCFTFIGLCGMHRFYLGKPITGFIYLITFGLLGFGQLIDAFRIRSMVHKYNVSHMGSVG